MTMIDWGRKSEQHAHQRTADYIQTDPKDSSTDSSSSSIKVGWSAHRKIHGTTSTERALKRNIYVMTQKEGPCTFSAKKKH